MKALLVIDIQNDFLPGGSLAVPQGDAVIEVANDLMKEHSLVIATQDWHPQDHLSFASQHAGKSVGETVDLSGITQILWPDHCIQDSHGSAFPSSLASEKINLIIPKGTDREIDSYSGFFDNARLRSTGLEQSLRDNHVTTVEIVGLATDYCVKFTALDAIDLGFQTKIHVEGIRGVNLNDGDCDQAIKEMRAAGVEFA